MKADDEKSVRLIMRKQGDYRVTLTEVTDGERKVSSSIVKTLERAEEIAGDFFLAEPPHD